MTTPEHEQARDDEGLPEPRCACGHVITDHDQQWICMADYCGCFFYDEAPG